MNFNFKVFAAVFALGVFPLRSEGSQEGVKLLTRIRQLPKVEGCAGAGTMVDYGLDLNRSGTLDDSEVKGSGRLCIADHVGVRQTDAVADGYCGVKHPVILFGKDVDKDGIVDANVLVGRIFICLNPTGTDIVKSYAAYGH